jgi:hypothetical protein
MKVTKKERKDDGTLRASTQHPEKIALASFSIDIKKERSRKVTDIRKDKRD